MPPLVQYVQVESELRTHPVSMREEPSKRYLSPPISLMQLRTERHVAGSR